MALWFLRGLRRGVVTTDYPVTPLDPWAADLPSPPEFRPDLLTDALAEHLTQICPSHALRHRPGFLVYDVGVCTACGRCLAAAGQAARPSGEIELATRERTDLVKTIPIRGGHR